jgi:S-adenosylmethionine:tRNA ribosyltransferase-isomerase
MHSIDLHDFRYILPESRIAKYPLSDRSASKLLIYEGGNISQNSFSELSTYLPAGSWLVFNNTRVIQARLRFRKETGARIEIFCLEPVDPPDYEQSFQSLNSATWLCLVGNAKKWKSGPVFLEITLKGEAVKLEAILKRRSGEGFEVTFQWEQPGITFGEIIEQSGSTPIPPYLNREAELSDKERYQTIYSLNKGSVAAPTAGLHFTQEMMADLEKSGMGMAKLTLHVGAGTFVPVKEQNVRDHHMHSELVVLRKSFLEQWRQKPEGLIAVGTTSTRSLESLYWLGVKLLSDSNADPSELGIDQWDHESLPQEVSLADSLDAILKFCERHLLEELHFATRLMIVPGYRFRTISGLLTNFHMPGSTLLLLIAAWIGEDWKKVYEYALQENFRFLSYGDSSLLIQGPKQ